MLLSNAIQIPIHKEGNYYFLQLPTNNMRQTW